MSDETQNSEEQQPEEEARQPLQPPEPEGGPLERERAFLQERFSRLVPKEERTRGLEPTPGPITLEPEPEEIAPEGPETRAVPLPEAAEARQRALEEYRERLQEKGETGPPGMRAVPPESAGFPPPPVAPVPPPANNWVPIGPSVLRKGQGGVLPAVSGRTPAIAVATGGMRVYAGAANGGVWRSDDSGLTWRSLMEAFDLDPLTLASDSLAVGAIAIDLANPDRVFVGSGEGAGGAYFGVGPLFSPDGGANWVTEPVAPGSPALAGSAFYALALDPGDPNRVVAGTRQGVYRREPDGAGGFRWAQKTMGATTWVPSVVAARSGTTTTFYGARWFGPVFSSTDGHTWNIVGTGFPTANVARISLAVQPNNPNIVYALVTRSAPAGSVPANGHLLGVWRLDTADGVWRQVTGTPNTLFGPDLTRGGQGNYDSAIAVAPDNANRIYIGGSTAASAGEWSGSLYRCEITVTTSGGTITGVSAAPTYIGGSVHADIHTIVFSPGNPNQMWVGCDGGVFFSSNPTGSGNIFESRNTGLATLTMNYMDQHPSEDAVLFVGTQDNGGDRFTGEEAWYHSVWGDSGCFVINWNDPYRVLATYVGASINRTTDGGTRYNYSNAAVTLDSGEGVLFYAPLVGTPPNPANTSEADIVAFGSIRPWISTNFGASWQSIPNGTLAGDSLDGLIKSLAFASANRLYAGTLNGGVYRFDRSGGVWTRTQIDTVGGASQLPLNGVVTDVAIDPADPTGGSIYITFGGTGDYRHVWHFNGAQWQQRSGPAAGNSSSLLDVQANAVIVDPANTNHIYVGADIGVWRSTDGGITWQPFSEGLPDASVLDLKIHAGRRLLRASTHGRSVYERTLDSLPKLGVDLFVRDTQLDQGRFSTVNWLPDPTAQGQVVRHWAGPDIKLDTPNAMGQYQFPLTGDIDFFQFVDTLTDDAGNVATHATATITTRVYVQVHNRGVLPANNVQVMLLLANASAGLPTLPAGYWTNVQTGMPINTANWRTVGIATLNDVRVGAPKIAAFNLTSNLLPPPANLAGNQHHCVLALIHHPNDQYTSMITITDNNSLAERKAAHKNLHVVQFTGTLPTPPPIMIPFRIHNAELEREMRTGVVLVLRGYPGRARLYTPPLRTAHPLEESVRGMKIDQDYSPFREWSEKHIAMIRENLESDTPYDKEWSHQRMEDVHRSLDTGHMFQIEAGAKEAELRGIHMEPDSYHTFFLAVDRPEDGMIGQNYLIDILQTGEEEREVIGGLTVRVELVKEPVVEKYSLELWEQKWLFGYTILRARLYDPQGNLLSPNERAAVRLDILEDNRWSEVRMGWHMSWRSFYYFNRSARINRAIATGLHNGRRVVEAQLGAREIEATARIIEREMEAD